MSALSERITIRASAKLFFIQMLLILLPVASPAQSIGEFPITPAQTLSGINSGLAADQTGNIWFTDTANDRIGRITTAGEVTVFPLPPYGQLTGGITAGPDGHIWFTKEFSGRILRITPAGAVTEFPVSIDSPGSIAAGADGNLWFTGGNLIGRITPGGEIAYFSPPTPFSSPGGITAGPDGNLWFVEIAAGKIGRITPDGVITEFPASVPPGQAWLFSITAGPDGNLWFTDSPNIGRITPNGAVSKFPLPDPSSYCYSITAGPDGNLWFAVNNRDRIGRITPDGDFLPELATPSAVSAPQRIIASPDGLIWFTESNTNKIGVLSLETVSGFFPLTAGTTWTYQKNGVNGFTRTVADVSDGVAHLQYSDGYEMYLSNDADGVRDHRELDAAQGTSVSFSPPFPFADARSAPGVPVYGSGTASVLANGDSFSGEYSSASTIQGIETITVPAGTFRTIKLLTSVTLGMTSVTQTNWVADGVGIVKEISAEGTFLLSTTSIRDTLPDRFLLSPQFAVAPGSSVISNAVMVTGITTDAPISISGGEYRIGSGSFTASPGLVANNQTVTVRQTASSAFETPSTASLTIGGFSAAFRVTTPAKPRGADLSKAIAILKLLVGMAVPDGPLAEDANGDGRTGLAEALIILQQLAGLRR